MKICEFVEIVWRGGEIRWRTVIKSAALSEANTKL